MKIFKIEEKYLISKLNKYKSYELLGFQKCHEKNNIACFY